MSSRTTPGSMGRYTLSHSESASSDIAGGGAATRDREIAVVWDMNSLRFNEEGGGGGGEGEDCCREALGLGLGGEMRG